MEIIFYLTLICLFISAFFLDLIFKKSTNSNRNLPPSPPSLPLIGHLHLLSPVITKCLHKISSKHGPFLHLRLGSRPVLVVSSAEFAAEIYKKHDITFSAKRPKAAFDDSLLFGSSSFITAPYGEYCRFMKKLCVTDLLGSKQIRRSIGVRREELMKFLEKLVEKANKKESIELRNEIMELTNNIICRMLMSTRCSKEDHQAEKCRKLVKGSLDLAGKMALVTMLGPFKKIGIWLNRKQLENIPTEFHKFFDKIIEEHEQKDKKDGNKDLMDILLKVYHDENAEFKISKTQIKAFLLDLFIAGTDTSGNTMEWVMAELINHPNVMNKLKNEIDSVVGTKRLVEESDVPNLHYLRAVVKETLRLHPVFTTNFRECGENCEIRGYDIPEGVAVIINAYSIMRDPKVWERPNEFYPERFLQENDKINKHNPNFVTFGGGRRICPGSDLALCMINMAIASMVQCFEWKVDKSVDMDESVGMIVSKASPLLCVHVLRFNPFVA